MALANLPPIQPPRKWLEDPEVKDFIQALNFAVYQLFQRSGGGRDNFDYIHVEINGLTLRVDKNEADIAKLQSTFSWKTVPEGETITVGVNQQMIVADGITISGDLILEGDLALI